MPRLTPERTAEADAIAHFYLAVERDINRNLIMSARVLDLLDAIDERIEVERRTVATLTARAEQAEKDRDALAAEVRCARTAWENDLLMWDKNAQEREFPALPRHWEECERTTDASGALQRAKGGAA